MLGSRIRNRSGESDFERVMPHYRDEPKASLHRIRQQKHETLQRAWRMVAQHLALSYVDGC